MKEKYSRWWYPSVVNSIRHLESPVQGERDAFEKAVIRQAIEETLLEVDGDMTVKVVELTLIKGTHLLPGVTTVIPGLSERKARRLRTKFIYKVGIKFGY